MPPHLKFLLSLIVCALAAVMFVIEHRAGSYDVAWVSVLLGAFMVFAVWLFPETKKRANPPRG